MSSEKLNLKWRNCTCCNFPTECRQEDIPERGCMPPRTVWLCAICANSEIGELVRNPLKHFGETGTNGQMRAHLSQQRREAAWNTNLLCAVLINAPRLWRTIESMQSLVNAEAVIESLDADLAAIKAAREAREKE